MRCHAGTCTDPDSLSPEDAVDDGGMPAHPQCATYGYDLTSDDGGAECADGCAADRLHDGPCLTADARSRS